MPLVGGGGSPNVAGGNPSGTGSSINFLRYPEKTLAYAYSGAITVNGSNITALDFSTGNETIDGKLMVQYMQDSSDGDDSKLNIKLNGELIGGALVATKGFGSAEGVLGPENWIPLIVPPFSRVQVLFTMLSGGGTIDLGVMLTGDVYA